MPPSCVVCSDLQFLANDVTRDPFVIGWQLHICKPKIVSFHRWRIEEWFPCISWLKFRQLLWQRRKATLRLQTRLVLRNPHDLLHTNNSHMAACDRNSDFHTRFLGSARAESTRVSVSLPIHRLGTRQFANWTKNEPWAEFTVKWQTHDSTHGDTQANATYQEGNAHLPSIPTGGTIRKTSPLSYAKVYCSPSASSATVLVNNRQHQDRHTSQVSPNFQKPSHKRASMAPCAFLISRILVYRSSLVLNNDLCQLSFIHNSNVLWTCQSASRSTGKHASTDDLPFKIYETTRHGSPIRTERPLSQSRSQS